MHLGGGQNSAAEQNPRGEVPGDPVVLEAKGFGLAALLGSYFVHESQPSKTACAGNADYDTIKPAEIQAGRKAPSGFFVRLFRIHS